MFHNQTVVRKLTKQKVMDKKTLIASIFEIAAFTGGILAFIHFNNDHIECENTIEYSVDQNG
ncbi:MAG: hypothetical protein ACI9AV_000424 [Sediminicola sp.]|jgi:hypothetical protein|tara:strand:+ start:112 stop:297 length:186 start_codon:yes stop_codon:yes gene_type:complete